MITKDIANIPLIVLLFVFYFGFLTLKNILSLNVMIITMINNNTTKAIKELNKVVIVFGGLVN